MNCFCLLHVGLTARQLIAGDCSSRAIFFSLPPPPSRHVCCAMCYALAGSGKQTPSLQLRTPTSASMPHFALATFRCVACHLAASLPPSPPPNNDQNRDGHQPCAAPLAVQRPAWPLNVCSYSATAASLCGQSCQTCCERDCHLWQEGLCKYAWAHPLIRLERVVLCVVLSIGC